ncbi:DUF4097 family beta strand repeat-containing protein [Kitasatospora aureofaciens]|uniref:DUF4097 family beta strand repeat-containing protein n=1 Tax=Kitasatospora aureofaciens TaxID=1894 RepID=UPI001D7C2C79|nr:DUF4097 family beta strand repeat-containing protein [Kitasatospora aureofaciens]HJD84231.1 DUF4097 domain-containing protein [Kitasatospora aureofaciens]
MDGAKAWRITGTLALVLVMLAAGVQTWSLVMQQQTSATKPYDVVIHQVRLETGSASVRLRAGREGHVVVKQRLDWMLRKPVVSATFAGDVLTVGMHCRQVLPFSDFGCGAEIELEVPAATEVTGSVSSGSVSVEGLNGSVRMQLTSGQLSLAHTSGELWAETTSGQVLATDLSAQRVTARTTSGSLELHFTRAPHAVDARATSGAVIMTVPKNSRYAFSSEVGSGSGGIDPALEDSTSPDSIHAQVTSGSLTVGPSS